MTLEKVNALKETLGIFIESVEKVKEVSLYKDNAPTINTPNVTTLINIINKYKFIIKLF